MEGHKPLKQLKNIIRGHKTYIQRLTKKLIEIQSEPLSNDNAHKLRAAVKYLEIRLENLDLVISELIVHPEVTDGLVDSAASYMAECREVIERAEGDLKRLDNIARAEESQGGLGGRLDSTGLFGSSGSTGKEAPKAKLPKAPFPTFSGGSSGSRDLHIFLRMFDDLVGSNCSASERVTYLRLGIKGEAEKLIRHIDPVPANFNLILETLKLQYKPREGECRELWGRLLSIQGWKKCNTSGDILNLIQHIRQHIYLIKELDSDAQTDHETLVDAIMVLLPERLMYDITKAIDRADRTVDRILAEMEKFIVTREEVASYYQGVPRGPSQATGGRSSGSPGQGQGGYQGRRGTHMAQAKGGTWRGSGGKSGRDSGVGSGAGPPSSSSSSGLVHPPASSADSPSCVYCRKSDHSTHTCKDMPSIERCREILRAGRHCYNCAVAGHGVRECSLASLCKCGRGKHSPSICFQSVNKSGNRINTVALPVGSGATFLETAWVTVENPDTGAWCKARVFIDRGSTDSYCTAELMNKLGCIPLDKQTVHIDTFATEHTKALKSQLVGFNILSNLSSRHTIPVQVLGVRSLCSNLPSNPLSEHELRQIAPYPLADVRVTQGKELPVDILIGMDYLWCIMKDRVVKTGFGPRLLETELGWIISGPLAGARRRGEISAHLIRSYYVRREGDVDSDAELGRIMHKLWDLDTLGVKESEVSPVIAHFNEHVAYTEEGRVQVRIPWKEEIKSYLPSNYNQALIRFNVMKQKLNRPGNQSLKSKYEAVMADQLDKGIIERVPHQDSSVFVNGQREPDSIDTNTALIGTNDESHQVQFYMPHHPVTKRGSDKVRVVFDASCQAYGGALSLNEAIHGGPSLLTDLSEALMRFRLNNVAIVGDISTAYLNLTLHPSDRDAFRFLWYDGDETLEYRFARVPFGVIVSAFLLNAVLRFHLGREFESHPELLEKVLSSLYVDDFLSGAQDNRSALELKEAVEVSLEKIGMKMHGWNSNSEELRAKWGSVSDDIVSVLGLLWNPVDDSLMVNVQRVVEASSCDPTKKNLLSLTASVWDPLGLVQPFLVLPKLLFQQICKSNVGWHGKLPEEMRVKWEVWKSQLPDLAKICLPRQVTLPEYDRVELHCFADASESAYAACCYVKCVYGLAIRVNLVFGKNRIAPVAAHSLPRLELLGACLLARSAAKVISTHSQLKFDKVVYYTDSKNVLHWIKSDNRQWSTFVLNRVVDIHGLTKAKDWYYVRSERNPADVATRVISGADLADSFKWFHGPTFLHDESISCEDKVDFQQPTTGCLTERKKSVKVAVREVPVTILDLDKHSNFGRVMRVTGYVLKFIALRVGKVFGVGSPSLRELHNLSVQYWVRKEQLAFYPNEVQKCPDGEYAGPLVASVSSVARSLRLFKDGSGLLRYASRVQDRFSTYDCSNPILLPKQSRLTCLYVAYLHKLLSHAGVGELLVHVRKSFWVPQGRSMVRAVVNRCVPCRKVTVPPYPVVAPPPLPDFRVNPSHPFEFTGVDTAGPIYYKVGKTKQKGHILILTCATTRAVALEFITGLSVENLMLGLRRFFAKYGLPRVIRSDNAKSFKRSQKELTIVSKSKKMKKYLKDPLEKHLEDHRISWVRYLERAPWWGGYIERCVQTVKRSLKRILGNAVLSFEEYTTVLYEVAALINSRPITSVLDSGDEAEPVSPAMLLCGRSLVQVPPMYELKVDGKAPQMCTGRLKYLEKLKSYFWTRWRREYMADLREIHSRRKVGRELRQPVVGELVLVRNEKLPRGSWKVGRVVELRPGRDGQVRSVSVLVVKGKKKTRMGEVKKVKKIVINRSPHHLVPLEGVSEL